MLFLGVDQSLTGTGIALVKGDGTCIAVRTIIGRKLRGAERLDMIRREVRAFFDAGNGGPDGPILRSAMEGGSFKSVHRGFDLGAVFGVLQADLYALGVSPAVVAPLLLKKFATGYAHAKKDMVVNAVKTTWKVEVADDNQADAIVLAQIARALFQGAGTLQYRFQVEVVATLLKPPTPRGARVRIRTNLSNV